MPDYEVINRELHLNICFETPSNFSFAKSESMVPIGHTEIPILAKHVPIVFVKSQNETFHLTVLLSLMPGHNEIIDENGNWLLPYVPAALRCHPFKLLTTKDSKDATLTHKVLGFIKDSPFITFDNDGVKSCVFDAKGNLTDRAQHLNRLLTALDKEASETNQKIEKLFELGLLAEIAPVDKDGKKTIFKNVFSVNGNKLAECSKPVLKELILNSTMDLIYHQKFSLVNFKNILKNRNTIDISTREAVLRENREKKATEINTLVQDLLIED